jgi:hypothetical protein
VGGGLAEGGWALNSAQVTTAAPKASETFGL